MRRSQGIEAWRNSETYQLYLEIGQRSLERGMQIKQLIDEYTSQSKPTLLLDEFEAISDLNRMLRF